MKIIEENFMKLIKKMVQYAHVTENSLNGFGGPSIYFHSKCINELNSNYLSSRHIELIYATLTSWGMHRMGNKNSQLCDFKVFKESIINKKELYNYLNKFNIGRINNNSLDKLLTNEIKDVFYNLKVSNAKNSFIVAKSKALHHLLPDLILPIDRQYTVRFFTKNKSKWTNKDGKLKQISLPNSQEKQYELFKEIVKKSMEFVQNYRFKKIKYLKDSNSFNSSHLKIMDNLIIEYIKSNQ